MTDESESSAGRSRRRRQSVGRTGARFPRLPEPDPAPGPAAPQSAPPDGEVPRLPGQGGPPTPSAPLPTGRGGAGAADDPLPGDPLPGPPEVGLTGARFGSRARRGRRGAATGPLPTAATAASGAAGAGTPAPRDSGGPESTVGRTGARFGSNTRRRRRDAARQAAQDAAAHPQAAPVPRTRDRLAPPGDDSPTVPLALAELRARADGIDHRVSVRPYVRTRGRTRSRADLRVETLVSLPSPRPPLDDPEHVAIGDVCDGPRSVAEVAALLEVPLGVARVLIGDMADQGSLTIHPDAAGLSHGPGPDRDVMARVLRGLHRL